MLVFIPTDDDVCEVCGYAGTDCECAKELSRESDLSACRRAECDHPWTRSEEPSQPTAEPSPDQLRLLP